MLLLYFATFSAFPYEMRENVIRNDCQFDVIRFKKENVHCLDYGKNVHYCNYYALPNEYVVYKEKGINNKEVFTIKPEAIYEKTSNSKTKLADFYYDFSCDSKDEESRLYLTIVPLNDFSFLQMFLYLILFIIILIFLIIISDNNVKNNSGFNTGYFMGYYSNSNKREIYCE
jgi:hypothetical protein